MHLMEEKKSNIQLGYEYISASARLSEIVEKCRQKNAVAIDTEFTRTRTYYPIVGLIQLFDGDRCYLIDPLQVGDLSALNILMSDRHIVKVLHACSEDMEVFHRCLGVMPAPVFDTQIAAAILGAGFSMSYQRLVAYYLDLHIEKGETRSDWLQRPLTRSQLKYASLDVIYLLHVFELQENLLRDANKSTWLEEECAGLSIDIPTQIEAEDYYRKNKNLWRLSRRELALVKSLSAWRERTARSLDVPRNRVLDEKSLVAIAQLGLQTGEDIRDKTELGRKQLARYADDLVSIIERVNRLDENILPDRVQRQNTPIKSVELKRLKRVVESRAKLMNVSVEIMAKRRHLEQLLRSKHLLGEYQLPKGLCGWREQAVGQALLRALL